jgi:hypothetical protein
MILLLRSAAGLLVAAGLLAWASAAGAEPFYLGTKDCEDCHMAEGLVWEGSKHFTSFREIHRRDKAKKILAAVGEEDMRRSEICTACHYTIWEKPFAGEARAHAGPSCESCHGPASAWINIHSDFGGPRVKVDEETAAHRAERLRRSAAAGMILPSARYDIAANCMACHGLANPRIDTAVLGRMLRAEHPFVADFELVRYSQGTVRHRFYRPDVTHNAVMTEAERARFYVVGQAAKLVSAAAALRRAQDDRYAAVQTQRLADARAALAVLDDMPEVAALIADPNEDHARTLVAAIADMDLSARLAAVLPDPGAYK